MPKAWSLWQSHYSCYAVSFPLCKREIEGGLLQNRWVSLLGFAPSLYPTYGKLINTILYYALQEASYCLLPLRSERSG